MSGSPGGSGHRGGRGRRVQNTTSFPTTIFPREIITLEKLEAAVTKAHRDLLAAGESVTTWKVTQSVVLSLQVDSWDSVGFHKVSSLRNLQFVEGKVNAFIHCFVSTRRMTSVHELDMEICQSEGVEQFEQLGLGPLLRHPLVQHYFLIPPDATEVCKITVEDMISRLTVFQYRMKYKEFTVEEFLDFLVQKYSVASRENLGVRIQSMGMYIKFIRKIKRTEDVALKSIQESGLPKQEPERLSDFFPEHLITLSSLIEDCAVNNNNNTTGTLEANSVQCSSSRSRKGKKWQGCSCRSTADVDEMKWIGLKLAMFNCRNGGKDSLGNEEILGNQARSYEIIKIDPVKAKKLNFTADELKKFIATWEGACQKHSVDEVLAMMLHIYKSSDKKKRKMERLFLSFPAAGLLNVAVRSIKCGELNSLIQDFNEHASPSPISTACTAMVDKEPSTEGDVASDDKKCPEKVENSISADDIIKLVANYFGSDHLVPRKKNLPIEEQLVIRDCEIWLSSQFSVREFKCLGHGSFIEFLEKHASLLPRELHYLMTGDFCGKSSLEVSMLQQQFQVLLFQAARYLGDSSIITIQYISMLLKKQFPAISFRIIGNEPEESFLDLVKSQKNFDISSSVTFSVALLGNCSGSSILNREEVPGEPFKTKCESVAALGSVSAKDAIECLLKAPNLSDLQSWSHWDLIFAPSLGPLLEWLLNIGSIKELSCIVTRDGRIIRIDHSATFDEFLEASIQGSSFQAAVKLISLFFSYGGSHNIPVSLLKCYCQRAFDVMIKNYMDHWEANGSGKTLVHSSLQRQSMLDVDDACTILVNRDCNSAELVKGNKLCEDLSLIDKAHAVVAMFILDCLGHLPSEFRSIAADILVSGLQFFTKDAYLIILCVCKQTEERIMLHEIGLSLGLVEWVKDYQAFNSATTANLLVSSGTLSRQSKPHYTEDDVYLKNMPSIANFEADPKILDGHQKALCEVEKTMANTEEISNKFDHCVGSFTSKDHEMQDASLLIETIRREEFGLDPDLENAENSLLKKQHARLGRALHCLSQELYSQDSHFILELVQNADDNNYPENVEPTLAFILQATGVVVMNNEQGFSAQNIRALCDVGSSTKKGSRAGYIGKKGIGFKSVFRVTDAPEIHSNGFHVKFDISDGQIGFVLPTIISPCNIDFFKKQLVYDVDQSDSTSWNTCIVLPFNSKIKQGMGISHIISLFSDLHPSLLLFLHRLQCIKFKNMLDDKLVTMRREILEDGIIKVSHGNEKMSWLVVNKNLQASIIRPDVQTTKIAIAFTLQDSDNGVYKPDLNEQPVFAFLPLRKYGLKFILQGDFVLPSSREEVDGDSAWNQWLLSEFPDLFVSAEKSFCALPCFHESPGKAVTAFMSFVPLMGEVLGFFSPLPRMILSRLRLSNCLLLDDPNVEWVPPCRVLRNWNEQARMFLPETLLQQHLGLGYLSKDIILPDSLAKALGIQEYGPKFLIGLLSSICHASDGIKLLGLDWLSSWLNALYTSFSSSSVHFSEYLSFAKVETESDLINCLRGIPFIPLSDGSYDSLAKGPIWLPCDVFSCRFEGENGLKHFPGLHAKLRTVSPLLFSTATAKIDTLEETRVDNIIRMLRKIGVQQLSAHDVIRNHILPSISGEKPTSRDAYTMAEYLSFIMIHLQSACSICNTERADIIFKLRKESIILTNYGYKCPIEEAIHFSKEFGNSFDVKKLIDNTDIKWNEVDIIYLKHPSTQSLSYGLTKWREFFQELGVTDFVQVINVEKNVVNVLSTSIERIPCYRDVFPSELFVKDWESPELAHLLSTLSSNKCLDKCKYVLEVLDKMWDDCFSAKSKCYGLPQSKEERMPFESSFMKSIHKYKWVASSIDEEVHYPRDLFYDCESVRSILGAVAPYAVPKVTSKRFLEDIGLKVQVTLDDALRVIQYWRYSETAASISQMSKFYNFIRDELSSSKEKITEVRSGISIFIPLVYTSRYMDIVPGTFMPPDKVYWHDPTGCLDRLRERDHLDNSRNEPDSPPCMILAHLYPGLHDFFVTDCGVLETLPFCSYLQILLQLSRKTSPSQSGHEVFQVFLKLADDLKSRILNVEDILGLKESLLKLENTVLPTVQGKWVSLHPRFGLICWSDDEELMEQCMHLNDVYFLQFGELTSLEKEMLCGKVAALMQNIGIQALTEVVSREAIFYGTADSTEKASLLNWVLPYVQRYLYKLHPDIYFHLKQSGFEKLAQLRVIAVEKLFYRYSLNGHCSTNRKRYECSCLLQGNILYTTPHVDSHSFFLELSRFFCHGTAELQIANFLHMITSMAELDSTEEQIESFIVNSQKVPKLPEGETLWSNSSLFTLNENEISLPICASPMITKRRHSNPAKKPFIKSNWPPSNWMTAPDLHSASNIHVREKSGPAPAKNTQSISSKDPETIMHPEDWPVPTEIDDKHLVKGDSRTTTALISQESAEDGQAQTTTSGFVDVEIASSSEPVHGLAPSFDVPNPDLGVTHSSKFIERDRLCLGILEEEQSYRSGRLGEIIAYKYFTEKLGSTAAVKWVNEESETGLPYDLIIGERESREYVEVKATMSASKDWFPISTNEWHCAAKKGDSFSIARVILSSPTNAKIFVLKNPLKLCQQNKLQLALIVPDSSENFIVT